MPQPLTLRFRLLGFLPVIFFLAQAIHYWRVGGMGNLLWMCNVGSLVLAIGLFLDRRELIRAAAIWTIPGWAFGSATCFTPPSIMKWCFPRSSFMSGES